MQAILLSHGALPTTTTSLSRIGLGRYLARREYAEIYNFSIADFSISDFNFNC